MFLIDIHLYQMIHEANSILHKPLSETFLVYNFQRLIIVVLCLATKIEVFYAPLFARMVMAKTPGLQKNYESINE